LFSSSLIFAFTSASFVNGVSDPPRENIKKAINRLRNYGVDDIVLLTGDLRQQAETIASRMSIDRYESELLPEDNIVDSVAYQDELKKMNPQEDKKVLGTTGADSKGNKSRVLLVF